MSDQNVHELKELPAKNRSWFVPALLGLALFVRLAYLAQLSGSILFDRPQGDALLHFNLAREIADGEWLGERVYYYAPMYPYFVAAVFAVSRTSVMAVAVVQVLLNTLDVWLVLSIASRIFGRRVGLIAGLLAACYGPFLFYTGFLLKETVGLVLLDAFVLVTLGLPMRPAWWASGLAGVLLGLESLVRPNLMPLGLPVVAWLWLEWRDEAVVRRVAACAAFAAGMVVAIGPVAVRNFRVGHEFVLISAHGGHNFFMGNRPHATGLYEPLVPGGGQSPYEEERDAKALAEQATGRSMTAAEVSRYWYSRGWREIGRDPWSFLRVTALKFALFWNAYEVPDVQDFYFVRQEFPALWLAPLTFGLVAPLAVVGAVARWRQWRICLLAYLVAAGVLATTLPFFIFGRYRLPVVPILIIFAAAGVARVAELVAARERRSLTVSAAVAAGAVLFVHWPIYRPIDFLDTSYFNMGNLYRDAGRVDDAEAAWLEAVRLTPEYAKPQRSLGELYFERKRYAEAIDRLNRGVEFTANRVPTDADACYMLGASYLEVGDKDAAGRLLRSGKAFWPTDQRFGEALADLSQRDETHKE